MNCYNSRTLPRSPLLTINNHWLKCYPPNRAIWQRDRTSLSTWSNWSNTSRSACRTISWNVPQSTVVMVIRKPNELCSFLRFLFGLSIAFTYPMEIRHLCLCCNRHRLQCNPYVKCMWMCMSPQWNYVQANVPCSRAWACPCKFVLVVLCSPGFVALK